MNKWQINKFGLLNFWYYDEEEFFPEEGRLLLRGSNGSGKSVTMQSFIPLLMDGNIRPERLDPFGSRARRIDSYILAEDSELEENTGYLYMEFKKRESDEFITLGMGIRAKRGMPARIWYFSLTDGRRIGKDFFLYKDKQNRIPFSKNELKNAVNTGGEVKESQKEYAAMVNRLIFGFGDVDEYEELVGLLINLRSPKLSKDFKPSATYEILDESLQPLSDEELRPMTEAIEKMDELAEMLTGLRNGKRQAEFILKAYEKYNRFILIEKLKKEIDAKDKLDKSEQIIRKTVESRKQLEQNYKALLNERDEKELDKKTLEETIQVIERSETFQIQNELIKLREEINARKTEFEKRKLTLEHKENERNKNYSLIKKKEAESEEKKGGLEREISACSDIAEETGFAEHSNMSKEFEKSIDKAYSFGYVKKEAEKLKLLFSDGKIVLSKFGEKREEYDNIAENIDKIRQEYEVVIGKLEAEEESLKTEKQNYIQQYVEWGERSIETDFTEDEKDELIALIAGYINRGAYYKIREVSSKRYLDAAEKLDMVIHEKKSIIGAINKEIGEKEVLIHKLETEKTTEFPYSESFLKYMNRLRENNIEYAEFWKVYDFKESVDSKNRGILEEIFEDTGILDSIVVDESTLFDSFEEEKYKILKKSLKTKDGSKNMAEYLKVDEKYTGRIREIAEEIINSISIEEENGEFRIELDGKYNYGIMKGKTTKNNSAKFIGAAARERYRIEKIELLRREIILKTESREREKGEKEVFEKRKKELEAESLKMPDTDKIDLIIGRIDDFEQNRILLQKQQELFNTTLLKIEAELRVPHDKIREFGIKTSVKTELESFAAAEVRMEEYIKSINAIEIIHYKYLDIISTIEREKERFDELESEIEDIKIEIKRFASDIDGKRNSLKEIEQRIADEGLEKMVEDLERKREGLRIAASRIVTIAGEIGKTEQELINFDTRLEELEQDKEDKLIDEKLYMNALVEELSIGYVIKFENSELNLKRMRELEKELEIGIDISKGRDEYTKELTEKFNINKQGIGDYQVNMEYRFGEYEIDDSEKSKQIKSATKRIDISGKIRGIKITFLEILENLNDTIIHDEKLLQDAERELFEDILIKTVSRKITEKIEHSEAWVKKMNALMEGMNTNTINLSLSWVSKKPETEEELHSNELVRLLRLDEHTRRQEDVARIINHFKSRIELAKKEIEKSENVKSFHKVMIELLDYRKWYDFKLGYRRGQGIRKELTQNEFFKFSGGEKAMTMYVPLFASVSARYENALDEAPRIISLDEAFAGVDEKNIKDMFRLMVELNFDFIINSQILWGDYDTVPKLGIAELYRPNNSDVVTVFRYKWDGKKRVALEANELIDHKSKMYTMF